MQVIDQIGMDVQAQELQLQVMGNHEGGADSIEADARCRADELDRPVYGSGVEAVTRERKRRGIAGCDLVDDVLRGIGRHDPLGDDVFALLRYRKLIEQCLLELLVAREAKLARQAHDRRGRGVGELRETVCRDAHGIPRMFEQEVHDVALGRACKGTVLFEVHTEAVNRRSAFGGRLASLRSQNAS